AADVEHGPERRFAFAESGFGAFEASDVGDCREQPDNSTVLPLRLVAAVRELRVGSFVGHLDFDVELDRLTGETLAEEGVKGRPGFVADPVLATFADHLLGGKAEPLRVVPVDEFEAGFCIAVRDGNRGVVRDKAQFIAALKILCRLLPGDSPSNLFAVAAHRSDCLLGPAALANKQYYVRSRVLSSLVSLTNHPAIFARDLMRGHGERPKFHDDGRPKRKSADEEVPADRHACRQLPSGLGKRQLIGSLYHWRRTGETSRDKMSSIS